MNRISKLCAAGLKVCAALLVVAAQAVPQQAPPPQRQGADMGAPELLLLSPSEAVTKVSEPFFTVAVMAVSVVPAVSIRFKLSNSGEGWAESVSTSQNLPVTRRITLTRGENRLTMTASNVKGESEPTTRTIFYEPRMSKNDDLLFLGIGVSRYRERSLHLAFPARDAQELAALFGTQEKSGVFDNVNSLLVPDEKASRHELINAFRWLKDKAGEADDVALVYIAGHFARGARGGEYYFLSYEHRPDSDLEINDLSVETIMRLLAGVRGRVILLIEQGGGVGKSDEMLAHDVVRSAHERFAVCMASPGSEPPVENAPPRERGFLAQAVIEGLRGPADRSGDGTVDVDELQNWLRSWGRSRPQARGISFSCSPNPSAKSFPIYSNRGIK